MEEDFPHQDNVFDDQTQDNSAHDQTQLEPHLSPEETEVLPTAAQTPLAEPQTPSTSLKRRCSSFIKALVISLLVFILLLAGTGGYALARPHIPGGSALVRITPDSQQLSIMLKISSHFPVVGVHTMLLPSHRPTSLTLPTSSPSNFRAHYPRIRPR